MKAYAGDLLDRALLVDTLRRVESELGPIDAIELVSPQDITVDNERCHLDLQVLAPIASGWRGPCRRCSGDNPKPH